MEIEPFRNSVVPMEALIITIGVVVASVLAGRFGVDTRAEDTSPWWPGPPRKNVM